MVTRLVHSVNSFPCTNYCQDTFTESNYRMLFGLALDNILRPWEKHILTLHFSEVSWLKPSLDCLDDLASWVQYALTEICDP